MSEGISRRDLVAVASASVALAACQKAGDNSQDAKTRVNPETAAVTVKTTVDDDFGTHLLGDGCSTPANSVDPRLGPAPGWEPFAPMHIHIVHIESPSSWTFRINQAHFNLGALTTNTRATRLARCVEILEERLTLTKTNPESRFYELGRYKPVQKTNGDWADYPNADKFGYGSQHEVFIFIDGGALTFNRLKAVSFGGKLKSGTTGSPNHAFFNSVLLDAETSDAETNIGPVLSKRGRIIRFENYLTKSNGKKLSGTEKLDYALNFHYGQPTMGGNAIPIIFDPDTGNGSGNEP